MQVLAVTILISLCLAGIFVVSYALESKRRRDSSGSPEHDALLPFDDEDTTRQGGDTESGADASDH